MHDKKYFVSLVIHVVLKFLQFGLAQLLKADFVAETKNEKRKRRKREKKRQTDRQTDRLRLRLSLFSELEQYNSQCDRVQIYTRCRPISISFVGQFINHLGGCVVCLLFFRSVHISPRGSSKIKTTEITKRRYSQT